MNTLQGQWHEATGIGPLPVARCGHVAVVVDKIQEFGTELVVIHGGVNKQKRALDDLLVLQVEDQEWLPLKAASIGPAARAFHTACVIGKDVYVFGGHVYVPEARRLHQFNDLWAIDTNTWEWHRQEASPDGPMPSPRDRSSMVALDSRRLLVYGGADSQGRKLNDLWTYDIQDQSWSEITVHGVKPSPRCSSALFILGSRIMVFGGDAGRPNNELWSLRGLIVDKQAGGNPIQKFKPTLKDEESILDEPAAVKWNKIDLPGPIPSPRRGHAATSAFPWGELFFGGFSEYSSGLLGIQKQSEYKSDIFLISIVTENSTRMLRWVEVEANDTKHPKPREKHSICALNGGRYLLLGGTDGKTTLEDIWWLQIEDISRSPSPERLERLSLDEIDFEAQLDAFSLDTDETCKGMEKPSPPKDVKSASYWSSISSIQSSLQSGMPAIAAAVPSGVSAALSTLSNFRSGRVEGNMMMSTSEKAIEKNQNSIAKENPVVPATLIEREGYKSSEGAYMGVLSSFSKETLVPHIPPAVAIVALKESYKYQLQSDRNDAYLDDSMLQLGKAILTSARNAQRSVSPTTSSKVRENGIETEEIQGIESSSLYCKLLKNANAVFSVEDCIQASRSFFCTVTVESFAVCLVNSLLNDYRRLSKAGWAFTVKKGGLDALLSDDACMPGRFSHYRSDELRIKDIRLLLDDYKSLLHLLFS